MELASFLFTWPMMFWMTNRAFILTSALAACRVAMISGSTTSIFLACRKRRFLCVMQGMTALGKTLQSLSSSLQVQACRVAMISGSTTSIFLACRKRRFLCVMQGMTALGKTLQSLSSSLQVHFLAAGTAIAAEAAVGALRQANGEILFSEGGDQAAQRSCSYPTPGGAQGPT